METDKRIEEKQQQRFNPGIGGRFQSGVSMAHLSYSRRRTGSLSTS
jgi:hypothetical protein